jgi:hypothetical protein
MGLFRQRKEVVKRLYEIIGRFEEAMHGRLGRLGISWRLTASIISQRTCLKEFEKRQN